MPISSLSGDKTLLLRGGHEGGEGGEEEEDVFGPEKYEKKWISTVYLPIFEIQKAFESSF